MKKYLYATLLAATVIFGFSCSEKKNTDKEFLNMFGDGASGFMRSSDGAEAKNEKQDRYEEKDVQDALSEGEAIDRASDDVAVEEHAVEETADYSGIWGDGCSIHMEIDGDDASVSMISHNYNCKREAQAEIAFSMREVIDNKVVKSFTDSWENKGNVTVNFDDDKIKLNVEITEFDEMARWNVNSGDFELSRKDVTAGEKYVGTWNYSEWSESAKFEIFRDKFGLFIYGTYSFADYIYDDETGEDAFFDFDNVEFYSPITASDDYLPLTVYDSYGNVITMELSIAQKVISGKTIDYMICKCSSFNDKKIDKEIVLYNSESEDFLRTIDMVKSHCSDGGVVSNGTLEYGGNILRMSLDEMLLDVEYYSYNGGNPNSFAVIYKTVELSSAITAPYTLTIPFDNDGWGNSGTLEIKLNETNAGNIAHCTVLNLNTGARTEWGASTAADIMHMDPLGQYNVLDTMSDADKRAINIFMSNFSEAHLGSYLGSSTYETDKLVRFALTHNLINNIKKISYSEDGTRIAQSDLDRTLNRFFGRTIMHEEPSDYWTYNDGYFCIPSATGQSRAFFTTVTKMVDLYEMYLVDFEVYFNQDEPQSTISNELYGYSSEQAAKLYQRSTIGKAVVTMNPDGSYRLLWYQEYN